MTLHRAEQQVELLKKMKSRPLNYNAMVRQALQELEAARLKERQTELPFEGQGDFALTSPSLTKNKTAARRPSLFDI